MSFVSITVCSAILSSHCMQYLNDIFLSVCVWSAAVKLTTTDCPWCITDTDSVLCTIEDFSVFHSLRDIIIAPLWQFRL